MKRYSHKKLRGLGSPDGFHIIRPDGTRIQDLHPRTIVRELNRLGNKIQHLVDELTESDRRNQDTLQTLVYLVDHIDQLEEAGDAMVKHCKSLGMEGTGLVKRWKEAKEDRP